MDNKSKEDNEEEFYDAEEVPNNSKNGWEDLNPI